MILEVDYLSAVHRLKMVKKSKKGADVEMKEASKSTTNGTATESGQSEEPKAEVSKEEQEKLVLEGMVWDKL